MRLNWDKQRTALGLRTQKTIFLAHSPGTQGSSALVESRNGEVLTGYKASAISVLYLVYFSALEGKKLKN